MFIMGNPGAVLSSTLRSCKGWSLGESEHTDHSLLPCGMLEPLGCTLSFCENTRELFVEENQYQLRFSIVSPLEHATMEQEVPGLVTRPLRQKAPRPPASREQPPAGSPHQPHLFQLSFSCLEKPSWFVSSRAPHWNFSSVSSSAFCIWRTFWLFVHC